MAQLTVDSLIDCNFIPDFIASGSKMLFNNTNAPTSWTKDSTNNNKALRIIGNIDGTTLSPGGNLTFTQVFPSTQKPVSGTLSQQPAGVSVNQNIVGSLSSGLIDVVTQSPISLNNATLTETQMASHSHQASRFPGGDTIKVQATTAGPPLSGRNLTNKTTGFNPTNTFHSHGLSSVQHNHVVTATQHAHTISNDGLHSHPFTTTAQDFNILYVDIIVAIKS
jgi:hypothetical protein